MNNFELFILLLFGFNEMIPILRFLSISYLYRVVFIGNAPDDHL